jgi:hypothetical protein
VVVKSLPGGRPLAWTIAQVSVYKSFRGHFHGN